MSTRAGSVQQFLLIYDCKRDEFLSHEPFGGDAVAAATAYRAVEIEYQDHPETDTVLVGAESLEMTKVTHSVYFIGSATRFLDEIRADVS